MAKTATLPAASGPMVRVDRKELRLKRQLFGLTQGELAELAGISFGYVAHIERGTRPTVSPRVFARLCDALHVQDRTELLITAASESRPEGGALEAHHDTLRAVRGAS